MLGRPHRSVQIGPGQLPQWRPELRTVTLRKLAYPRRAQAGNKLIALYWRRASARCEQAIVRRSKAIRRPQFLVT